MAKLIRSALECGHRVLNGCHYDTSEPKWCVTKGEQNFPDNCPLEDGVSLQETSNKVAPMPLTTKDLIDIDEVVKDTEIPIECLHCDNSDITICKDCQVIKDSYQKEI